MNSGIIRFLLLTAIIFLFVYIVKNKKNIKMLYVLVIIFLAIFLVKNIKETKYEIISALEFKNNTKSFDLFDLKKEKEIAYYETCMEKDYSFENKEPYILDGFSYLEGTIDTGFVIQDEDSNQFVWIPIKNKSDLVKKDFVISCNIKKAYCLDENYEEFISSSLENGGFYISRFETGIENGKIVSKKDREILCDMSIDDVKSKVENMYNGEYHCELIGGYAYDTAIEWIRHENNDIESFYYEEAGKLRTGRNQVNNVYDIFDNIFEYTNETSYDTQIIRGVLEENNSKEEFRYAISKNDKKIAEDIVTSRLVLYK